MDIHVQAETHVQAEVGLHLLKIASIEGPLLATWLQWRS